MGDLSSNVEGKEVFGSVLVLKRTLCLKEELVHNIQKFVVPNLVHQSIWIRILYLILLQVVLDVFLCDLKLEAFAFVGGYELLLYEVVPRISLVHKVHTVIQRTVRELSEITYIGIPLRLHSWVHLYYQLLKVVFVFQLAHYLICGNQTIKVLFECSVAVKKSLFLLWLIT